MDPYEISTCERMVMKVVWESEEALDLANVMSRVNEEFSKDWKPQTVSTFLARLVRKGYLSTYRKGRYTYYQPLVDERDFKASTVSENINYFDHGNIGAFVCSLFDNMKLTKEDRERIKKKIDELDQSDILRSFTNLSDRNDYVSGLDGIFSYMFSMETSHDLSYVKVDHCHVSGSGCILSDDGSQA